VAIPGIQYCARDQLFCRITVMAEGLRPLTVSDPHGIVGGAERVGRNTRDVKMEVSSQVKLNERANAGRRMPRH
jgi:hypothetical protein